MNRRTTTIAVVTAVFLVGVLAGPAAAGTAGAATFADPAGDFVAGCTSGGAPGTGDPAMDIVEVRVTRSPNGAARFRIRTRGDVARYFATRPPSAAIMLQVLERQGGRLLVIAAEYHDGVRSNFLELDGKRVEWPFVEIDGEVVDITVTHARPFPDPEPVAFDEARWGVTGNNIPSPGADYVCDDVGTAADGTPALPLPPAVATPSTTAAPAATDPPPTTTTAATSSAPVSPPAPSGQNGEQESDDGAPISLFFLIGSLFGLAVALFLLWWWFWRRWRDRRWGSPDGGHGAPATPPPENNDFGE